MLKRCFQLTKFSSDNISAPELHKILLSNHNSINVLDVRCARTTVPQSQYALEELPKLHRLRVTLIQSCCAALLSEVLVRAGCLQTLCVAVNHQEVLFTFNTPCPRLQNLKLNTQEDLRITNLVTNCQHIVNLDLQYCFNLRDDDILAAAKHLHHLRSLNVYNCWLLTNQSLQHLGDHRAATLQLLYLGEVGTDFSMTRNKMDWLVAQCKQYNSDLTLRCVQVLYRQGAAQKTCDEESTILLASSGLNDQFASECTVHSNAAILRLPQFHFQFTTEGLTELCTKLPKLRTLVVDEVEERWLNSQLAENFPQLTVTSDASVYEYDLISMRI